MISSAESLQILSLVPGRVRLHLPNRSGDDREQIENRLRRIKGAESVRANSRTGNVLIHFDRRITDETTLLGELDEAWASFVPRENFPAPRAALCSPNSTAIRIGIRGVLGHAAVDSLWFGAGFLGESIGLPLAGLGPLHVLMDIIVWAFAIQSGLRTPGSLPALRMPSEPAG
jgi:hypothetical protein